jgi:hypothetical protein
MVCRSLLLMLNRADRITMPAGVDLAAQSAGAPSQTRTPC